MNPTPEQVAKRSEREKGCRRFNPGCPECTKWGQRTRANCPKLRAPDQMKTEPSQGIAVKCCQQVADGNRWPSFHQCTRWAKVERNGKPYCKIHDPEAIAAENARKLKVYQEHWAKEEARAQLAEAAPDLLAALKAIVARADECGKHEACTLRDSDVQAIRDAIAKAEGGR